jgi:hypothetical protein
MRVPRRVPRIVLAAAALGLAVAGGMAQPASAASWQQYYGMHCGGIQVDRCSWLDWDRSSGRIRAGGNTRDEPGGGDYSVALTNVQVQVLPFGGPWTTIGGTVVGDYDGWQPVWDAATSGTAGYWCGFQYRALSYHRWTGASTGGEWIASDPVTFC